MELPRKILIAEDDPNDLELVRLALGLDLTSRMDVVHDGEQTLHYLLGQPGQAPTQPLPRLLLLDLKLPKINGIQVLHAIRNHPRTRQLVVVVMTSSQEDQDLNACYGLGVNSYVVKPLEAQQFAAVAQQVGLYWMTLNRPPLAV
ncbi:MAG: response regulator [Kaiparowitsia implicata GSE-PSE-MK54-09C]|nr:response regulator [Kaiparowitsia implicata GSE-PSE-MK54-09C]